jgi:hypothetical protein
MRNFTDLSDDCIEELNNDGKWHDFDDLHPNFREWCLFKDLRGDIYEGIYTMGDCMRQEKNGEWYFINGVVQWRYY